MADFSKAGTEYSIELTKQNVPCLVKVGGKGKKFVPNINMSKWNDECWLNINHPDVVASEIEQDKDGKISLSIGERTHRYYIDPDGKLEYEIELAKRPVSNEIVLNLDFPDGLNFYKQLPLSEEKIAAGFNRPENAINSYAVYWCKSNNKYLTGKHSHIYRIKLIAADGKWTWADQDITGKLWSILMDGKWLDQAAYPVIVDPVLGYDTVGASNVGHSTYTLGNFYTTDGSGGAITKFHCAVESVDGSLTGIKLGVYETNGSGDPSGQDLVEQVVGVASVTTDLQIDPSTGETLAASTEYWIGYTVEGNDTDVYYDSVAWGQARHRIPTVYADMFTNPAGTHTQDVERSSVWLDYGGGGPSGPSLQLLQAHYMRRHRA